MVREEIGVTLTMKNISEAPKGSVYKPSIKRKQIVSDSDKVVEKPPKRKVVHQTEIQRGFNKWLPQLS